MNTGNEAAKKRYGQMHAFYEKHRRMPSYQEALKVLGVKSKDTAYRQIRELVVLGFLERDHAGKLVPKKSDSHMSRISSLPITRSHSPYNQYASHDLAQAPRTASTSEDHSTQSRVKVLGLIEAGFPTPAEESLLDSISLDEWLIPKREASFMLKVKGNSMKDAGINDGDMVIAERANTAPVGSIVVAEIDGDWTLKYLRKNSKGYYLEAANDEYPDLRPKEKLSIAAIVRGVIRKYK